MHSYYLCPSHVQKHQWPLPKGLASRQSIYYIKHSILKWTNLCQIDQTAFLALGTPVCLAAILSLYCHLPWGWISHIVSTPGICTADSQMFLSIAHSHMSHATSLSWPFIPAWALMYATVVVLSVWILTWMYILSWQKVCKVRKAAFSSFTLMCHLHSTSDQGPPVSWPSYTPQQAKSKLSLERRT